MFFGARSRPADQSEYRYTPFEREMVKERMASQFVGDVATVATRLEEFVEQTGADELIVTTMTHGHEDRVTSYRLLAREWGLGTISA